MVATALQKNTFQDNNVYIEFDDFWSRLWHLICIINSGSTNILSTILRKSKYRNDGRSYMHVVYRTNTHPHV